MTKTEVKVDEFAVGFVMIRAALLKESPGKITVADGQVRRGGNLRRFDLPAAVIEYVRDEAAQPFVHGNQMWPVVKIALPRWLGWSVGILA